METCEMCQQPVEKKEFYACTGWTIEDVMTEADFQEIKLSEEEARAILTDNADKIVETMVNAGQDCIHEALQEFRPKGGL